ncbi:MAG: hypothetical protein MRY64_02275 [Hyphomonadaceae bacterium]|nr:hypothetical protein [Hyphomonadaceae bacterium]
MGWLTDLETRAKGFLSTDDTAPGNWWIWFAAITLAGTVMRFWNLSGAPIWMDEAVTLGFARLDMGTIIWGNIDNHPNLTWVIQKLWHSINPDPAYARVPAAFFGSLSVAAILLAARDMASARAAIFTGLLFAFATGHIYYSQDARMYPYLIFGLILAAWGGIGHVRPNLYGARTYAALYIVGGAIAIYSHAIGLIVMGLIGFASLVAGWLGENRITFARDWLIRNLILFVITLPWLIALPSASGTFPGLSGDNSIFDIQWFYRNITGFPGLGGPAILFEALFYGLAALSIPIAWLSGRRGLAFTLLGLIALFPIVILILHLRQPLLANKVLLPGVIGVTLGAGYALSCLKPKWAMSALGGVLILAAFGSAATELRYHIKSEDYRGAYDYAAEQGFGHAPALTCIHFHAAAAWENRREGRVLYYRRGDVIDYKSPDYWRAAENTMTWLRAAEASEIDDALGGGWLIEGGLEAALAEDTQLLFIRPSCPAGREAEITAALEALGFHEAGESLIQGKGAERIILEEPQTRITLFERAAE